MNLSAHPTPRRPGREANLTDFRRASERLEQALLGGESVEGLPSPYPEDLTRSELLALSRQVSSWADWAAQASRSTEPLSLDDVASALERTADPRVPPLVAAGVAGLMLAGALASMTIPVAYACLAGGAGALVVAATAPDRSEIDLLHEVSGYLREWEVILPARSPRPRAQGMARPGPRASGA